ncbi:hypothetical protein ALON55S_08134 [Alishewanella longhuensis]
MLVFSFIQKKCQYTEIFWVIIRYFAIPKIGIIGPGTQPHLCVRPGAGYYPGMAVFKRNNTIRGAWQKSLNVFSGEEITRYPCRDQKQLTLTVQYRWVCQLYID